MTFPHPCALLCCLFIWTARAVCDIMDLVHEKKPYKDRT